MESRAFAKIARGDPQTGTRYLSLIDAWHTLWPPTIAAGQWRLRIPGSPARVASFLLRLDVIREMIICVWRDRDDTLRLLDYSV